MLIKTRKISKYFYNKCLYKNVSVTINRGDKICLVGENGSGKTTLFKILYGIESVDSGHIDRSIEANIGYLSQLDINQTESIKDMLENSFSYIHKIEEELHMLENNMGDVSVNSDNLLEAYQNCLDIFETYGGYEYEKSYKEFINIFGIDNLLDRKYSELSGGQKQYIRLCLILFGKNNLIFLDEPNSYLDNKKTIWLKNYIKNSSKAFLITSHDVDFISKICTKYFDIHSFQVHVYYGNYDSYIQSKREHLSIQAQKNTTAINKVNLLKDTIYKQYKWMDSAEDKHKHKVVIDRLKRELKKETDKIVYEKKSAHKIPTLEHKNSLSSEDKNILVKFDDISVVLGEKMVLSKVNLTVHSRMHLIILGENGTGKTTFLNIIAKKLEPYSGMLYVKKKLSLAYVEQGFIDDNMTCMDYLSSATGLSIYQSKDYIDELFGAETDYSNVNLRLLSGGEKKRLQIGASVIQNPDIILLDEPTVSLDEYTVSMLLEVLENFNGAVIVASHDARFKNVKGFITKTISTQGNLV